MTGEARAARPFRAGDRVALRDDPDRPGRLTFRVRKVYPARRELEIAATDPAVRLTSNKTNAFRAWSELFVHAR